MRDNNAGRSEPPVAAAKWLIAGERKLSECVWVEGREEKGRNQPERAKIYETTVRGEGTGNARPGRRGVWKWTGPGSRKAMVDVRRPPR